MSGPAARVQYLAHLGCPLGAAARGRARVLGTGARLFLSTGGRFVHVYDREGQQLSVRPGAEWARARAGGSGHARAPSGSPAPRARQAVLEFPAPVWHLQPLDRPAALLALCARSGLYRVALDPASRWDGDARGRCTRHRPRLRAPSPSASSGPRVPRVTSGCSSVPDPTPLSWTCQQGQRGLHRQRGQQARSGQH